MVSIYVNFKVFIVVINKYSYLIESTVCRVKCMQPLDSVTVYQLLIETLSEKVNSLVIQHSR